MQDLLIVCKRNCWIVVLFQDGNGPDYTKEGNYSLSIGGFCGNVKGLYFRTHRKPTGKGKERLEIGG
jgi:hypothetical protein